jgi:hypothetical protein
MPPRTERSAATTERPLPAQIRRLHELQRIAATEYGYAAAREQHAFVAGALFILAELGDDGGADPSGGGSREHGEF